MAWNPDEDKHNSTWVRQLTTKEDGQQYKPVKPDPPPEEAEDT
jgi:hypothetical protein